MDVRLLFFTRMARLFAYGFLSVILALYLAEVGLSEAQIGLLLTLTLAGDTVISLWITTNADRLGRRRMLIIGAALMVFAGLIFAFTRSYPVLILAATIGVISPSGNEIGPFLAVEQAALSQIVPGRQRTSIFAWYNLVGSFATAAGRAVRRWAGSGAAGRRPSPSDQLPGGGQRLRPDGFGAGGPVFPALHPCGSCLNTRFASET